MFQLKSVGVCVVSVTKFILSVVKVLQPVRLIHLLPAERNADTAPAREWSILQAKWGINNKQQQQKQNERCHRLTNRKQHY